MSEPQEIAEAISAGLNCIAEIEGIMKEGVASKMPPGPAPEWQETLRIMERALEAVASKAVTTTMVVGNEDIERIRRMRALISAWIVEGRPSPELRTLATTIFNTTVGGDRP